MWNLRTPNKYSTLNTSTRVKAEGRQEQSLRDPKVPVPILQLNIAMEAIKDMDMQGRHRQATTAVSTQFKHKTTINLR